jgi:hypothetical protein
VPDLDISKGSEVLDLTERGGEGRREHRQSGGAVIGK